MKCVVCGKQKKTNRIQCQKIICWDDYQMCANCCIEKHPERYPLNVINQFLGKSLKPKRKPRYCLKCNEPYFAKGYCKYHYFNIKREWKTERN